MELYNILGYSDNFPDTKGSLYHYRRPNQNSGNGDVLVNITNVSTSFKYQSELIKKQMNITDDSPNGSKDIVADADPTFVAAHRAWKNVKIAIPLKYTNNFLKKYMVMV